MPTYGYECTACKEQFEVIQKMTDQALAIHEGCGGELRRLLYPVGIVFKGAGFHVNDYGRNGKKADDKPVAAKTEEKVDSPVADATKDAAPSATSETKSEAAATKAD